MVVLGGGLFLMHVKVLELLRHEHPQREEEVISNRPSRGVFFMSEVKVAERQSARELVCERGREE